MKQGGIALPLRCRAVGQGKQYPYLGTPSAGTAESGKGLWQQGGLLLYIFRFGNARQTVYFQLYESRYSSSSARSPSCVRLYSTAG